MTTSPDQKECAYSIDRIDAFATFVSFSLHPMPIEIREQAVDVVCAYRVAIPLASIIS